MPTTMLILLVVLAMSFPSQAQITSIIWHSTKGSGTGTCVDDTTLPAWYPPLAPPPSPAASCQVVATCAPGNRYSGIVRGASISFTCPNQSVLNTAATHQVSPTEIQAIAEAEGVWNQALLASAEQSGDCNLGLAVGPTYEYPQDCTLPPPPPPPPPPPNCGTPIIIDTAGEGFHLTSAKDGVIFDLRGDGSPLLRWAWTAPGSRNAFLALDRNGDGRIESGKELFGNFTAQSDCPADQRNGFRALAEYDLPENGGNGDGVIDERDEVFKHLRLWIDRNHDGVSQTDELYTLPQLGVTSLGLAYTEQLPALNDEFGNWFRLKGQVNPEGQPLNDHVDRVMYDVYLRARTIGDPVGGTSSHLGGAASVTPAGAAGVDLPCCNGGTCGGG